MYDNLGYVGEIQEKINELEVSIKALRRTGSEYAEAEREYQKTKWKKALELRDKKVPISLICMGIKGEPEVADALYKRIVKETIYEANKDHINATKLELRLLEGQLSREWGRDLDE